MTRKDKNLKMMTPFPEGFYWGASTASYQVEGGIENTDWAAAARQGRVPVCGRACDHYDRYEADFDIAKELGHNAHRFSIEWARIEPEEGVWDEVEIEHYRKVIRALKARGMHPFVTLWHFTLPLWFAERGGFERRENIHYFARYAKKIAETLGTELEGISTMNEPNVFATQGWINGEWPPFKVSLSLWKRSYAGRGKKINKKILGFLTYFKVMKNLSLAHNLAYKEIKKICPKCKVSVVKHIHVYLTPSGFLNKIRARLSHYFQNERFMRSISHSVDEIGLNYYQASQFGKELTQRKTDMGWYFIPDNIYNALKILSKYNVPLFVSEAGIADHDDDDRAEYIERQIEGVKRALEDGIDVRGHMYWSLLDNYEWALGFEKRFGLIDVDYETLERTVRPSAYHYRDLIEKYSK